MKKLLTIFMIISSSVVFAYDNYLNCVLNEHESVGSEENPAQSTVYSTKLKKNGTGSISAKAINFPTSASASIYGDKSNRNRYSISLMINQLDRGATVTSQHSIGSNGEVAKLKLQQAHESSVGSIVFKCKISKSNLW